MTDSYLAHHLELLKYLQQVLVALAQEDMIPEEHSEFLERYADMIAEFSHSQEALYLGQEVISQVFQRYPQIAHQVPRDLLWFFGGECLHYMPDEEIAMFQQLEERRFEALELGEDFDWNKEVQLTFMPTMQTAH